MASASRAGLSRRAASGWLSIRARSYATLLKLEQEGFIASSWRGLHNNRKARFYELTRAGRRELAREASEWRLTTDIIGRFLAQESDQMVCVQIDPPDCRPVRRGPPRRG